MKSLLRKYLNHIITTFFLNFSSDNKFIKENNREGMKISASNWKYFN